METITQVQSEAAVSVREPEERRRDTSTVERLPSLPVRARSSLHNYPDSGPNRAEQAGGDYANQSTFVHADIPCEIVRYAGLKRGFDIFLACVGIVFGAPFMIVTALLVKLTSRGPVIFKQIRVGRGGKCFTCYKFRSMCADAEERRHAIRHLNEQEGPVFKIKRDPRLTPIGALIRKFSLDELPQLVNVLKGDMSIVGPRPPISLEVEHYGVRERRRLAVQPGLTCLWQISGRSEISFEKWIDLDIEYIETMTFAGDLRILLKTIPAVITGKGAH